MRSTTKLAKNYQHSESESSMRMEAGAEGQVTRALLPLSIERGVYRVPAILGDEKNAVGKRSA